MESTILCMLTSALCLFTWAFGSMVAVANVTQPTVSVPRSNWTTTNMSNPSVYPTHQFTYDNIVELCWKHFNETMFKIDQEHWCNWEHILRIYSNLQYCLESSAEFLYINFPNELAHNTILKAHLHHFKNCSLLSEELMDPPENILLGLIFAPICIIPFLVTLVVYKSNSSRPQT